MLDKIKEIYFHQIFRIIILLIVLWIAATIGIQYLEHGELNDIENAFWWTIVTITTVGYGDMFISETCTSSIQLSAM